MPRKYRVYAQNHRAAYRPTRTPHQQHHHQYRQSILSVSIMAPRQRPQCQRRGAHGRARPAAPYGRRRERLLAAKYATVVAVTGERRRRRRRHAVISLYTEAIMTWNGVVFIKPCHHAENNHILIAAAALERQPPAASATWPYAAS